MPENYKKILFFLTRSPYPSTDGTRKKIAEDIIEGLGNEFVSDVFLVGPKEQEDIVTLKKKFHSVNISHLSKIISLLKGFISIYSGRPLQVEYFFRRSVLKQFREDIKNYDVVYVHTIRLGRYIEELSESERKKIFFDFNDAISLNYKEAKHLAFFPWNIVFWYEEKRVRKYESRVLSLVQHAHVVSDFDEDYLNKNCDKKNLKASFYQIYAGVDIHNPIQFKLDRNKPMVLFFGNAKYPPNKDAAEYFGRSIFPIIKSEMPNLVFEIAGGASESLSVDGEDIIKHGFVDNLDDLFIRTTAIVAPIRFGAGVPTKILEALSCGIPVITTSLGVRGLVKKKDWSDVGIVCIPEEGSAGWTTAIQSLVNDGEYRNRLSGNAIQYIRENYSRDSIRTKYKAAFESVIKKNLI